MRSVLAVVRPDDGIEFVADTATAEVIREDNSDSDVRVHVEAHLASAKLPFHVDVNVGDPIWPEPTTATVPRLRGGAPIELPGYAMHMVHAEKIVTAIQRGTANTRWRDFGDIWNLSRRHRIDVRDLREAIEAVACYRNATVRPLADVLDGFEVLAQSRWSQWRRRSNSTCLKSSRLYSMQLSTLPTQHWPACLPTLPGIRTHAFGDSQRAPLGN